MEADRRKDEFLATLAHELRNPLAPIRTGLQVMRMAKGDERAVEDVHRMMERQVAQMVRLVDDLLDISRITRDKIERLARSRVELATIGGQFRGSKKRKSAAPRRAGPRLHGQPAAGAGVARHR